MLNWIIAAVLFFVAAIMGLYFAIGPERFWEKAAGPADQGPINFKAIKKRSSPNWALAAPEGFSNVEPHIESPVYNLKPDELKAALHLALEKEENLERLDEQTNPLRERYIQRTKRLRFPDTLQVEYIDRGDGKSSIALISLSQIGHSDLGVNRARIERWLSYLAPHELEPAT